MVDGFACCALSALPHSLTLSLSRFLSLGSRHQAQLATQIFTDWAKNKEGRKKVGPEMQRGEMMLSLSLSLSFANNCQVVLLRPPAAKGANPANCRIAGVVRGL